ncbi:transmembrane protein, putative (macronuclear) [Tetrahymena thermophila SB210]|uniref:Transmembrane protein, putative n=1 Tax=Tetrahymena thermophila (strain SB210) TaxID=312017 RepID=W7X798_TETTS|nr:transmembrane protein, putative [Tetrahymena thermophila SB210]EWS72263.1 transmembrane protein, putative [Tetrahymena thermophila SB210]|eukprot:XP_012655203.1 transmembrane protein, putative [Tetrahymena thermophila SB210]
MMNKPYFFHQTFLIFFLIYLFMNQNYVSFSSIYFLDNLITSSTNKSYKSSSPLQSDFHIYSKYFSANLSKKKAYTTIYLQIFSIYSILQSQMKAVIIILSFYIKLRLINLESFVIILIEKLSYSQLKIFVIQCKKSSVPFLLFVFKGTISYLSSNIYSQSILYLRLRSTSPPVIQFQSVNQSTNVFVSSFSLPKFYSIYGLLIIDLNYQFRVFITSQFSQIDYLSYVQSQQILLLLFYILLLIYFICNQL